MPSDSQSKWLRYRHKWAWGIDKEWDYVECDLNEYTKECVREFILDADLEKYNEDEHYRGIEYELVNKPDNEWLVEHLKEAQNAVRATLYQERRARELLGLTPAREWTIEIKVPEETGASFGLGLECNPHLEHDIEDRVFQKIRATALEIIEMLGGLPTGGVMVRVKLERQA